MVAAVIAQSPSIAHSEGPPPVSFTGSGWGHGVGMSQYGARAMAGAGRDADEIVDLYFSGSDVVPLSSVVSGWLVDDPQPLWVNLISRAATSGVSFAAVGDASTFCQQEPAWVGTMSQSKNGEEYAPYIMLLEQRLIGAGLSPGPVDGLFDAATTAAVKEFQSDRGLVSDGLVGTNTKNALWPPDSGDRCVIATPLTTSPRIFTPNFTGSECTLSGAVAPGDCVGSVRDLTQSKRVSIPERKIRNGGTIELAHGDLRVRPDRSGGSGSFEGLHVLVEIGVDDYVRGIDEMPFSWPTQALRAQAIASRSYGVGAARSRGPESGFSGSLRDTCWCHLWSSTSSQVYAGYFAEIYWGGAWKNAAIATASKVLEHPTAGLVTAYFSSSNGGASEANEDAWGSPPVSYLRSVPDQWSLDPVNPYSTWTYTFPADVVAEKVGMDQLTGVEVIATNQSGSAKTVRFVGTSGGTGVVAEKTGSWVRSQFGLRSNFFGVTWGDATPPPAPTPALSEGFTDIAGNTFIKDIEWAYEEGVTKGCNPPDNTLFCPGAKVSRGQMAAFIGRFLGLPATSQDFFTDDNGSTFESDINRLAAAGITKGCGGSRFCPGQSVTREQMAAFLVRAFHLVDDDHPGFADVSPSSTFAADISKLATAGITKGCNPPTNSKYCPRDSVTRAQMTAFLHRAAGS